MKLRAKKFILGTLIGFLILLVILAGGFWLWVSSVPPGRSNFLLLGITNDNRAGADLTDAIIFASVDHQSGRVTTLSLPRDLWIAPLRAKINTAYHYGGFKLTKPTVAEVLGQKVDYALLVDANLFVEAIDALGGVEIKVERAFDDFKYPLAGKENDECGGDPEFKCRYEHLHFDSGRQLMDGQRALKYVRSRYAEGEEGTDFARSQRQQNLLLALKDKFLSQEILLRPQKLVLLFEILKANVKTDLPQEKWPDFFKIALRFRPQNLKTFVLDENLLINPAPSLKLYDGQWVLVPKAGDWSEIQEYVGALLL